MPLINFLPGPPAIYVELMPSRNTDHLFDLAVLTTLLFRIFFFLEPVQR